MQSQKPYVLSFQCRNDNEPHHYRGTAATLEQSCSCGELIDFASAEDASHEFIKYSEQLGAYLGVPTKFAKVLVRTSCFLFFDKGNRRLKPGATLKLFHEEYGSEGINNFADYVENRLKELRTSKEFWVLYFAAYSQIFQLTNTNQKVRFAKYKRTYSKADFLSDVSKTQTTFSVFEGKTSDEKLHFLSKLFIDGRPDLTEQYVLWYFNNGASAKKFNMKLVNKNANAKSKKGTYPAATPHQEDWQQSTGWVRGAGKGGIHNWTRY